MSLRCLAAAPCLCATTAGLSHHDRTFQAAKLNIFTDLSFLENVCWPLSEENCKGSWTLCYELKLCFQRRRIKPYIVHFFHLKDSHTVPAPEALPRFLGRNLLWHVCLPPSCSAALPAFVQGFSLPAMSPVRSIQEISSLGLRTGTIISLVVQWLRLCAPNAERAPVWSLKFRELDPTCSN